CVLGVSAPCRGPKGSNMSAPEQSLSSVTQPHMGPEHLGIGPLFWRGPDAILGVDAATGRIVLWNSAAEALFGYTAAEAYALPLTAIFPGVVDNVVFAGGVSEAAGPDPAEAPIPSFELPARHKTGAPFAVALAVWPTDS